MRSTPYRLKQAQYAAIYKASERTVRNWMKRGAPLDDPHAMLADFLPGQRSLGAETRRADLLVVELRYQQAKNPEAERQTVTAAMGDRLDRLQLLLTEARNFAHQHKPENAEQVAKQLDTMMHDMDGLFKLASIGEDFERPEGRREDLAKPVMVCAWANGDGAAVVADDDSEEGEETSEPTPAL